MWDRAKTTSTIVLKVGLAIFLLTLVVGAAITGVFLYREHRQSERQQVLIESAGKSITEYQSETFNGTVHLRTRYEPSQTVSYDLTFRSDSHYRLADIP